MKVVVSAAFALALFGCGGGQPTIYRVAVDTSPVNSLQASCYQDSRVPDQRITTTNVMPETQWVVWDGVDNTQYLDMGGAQFKLGDARPIQIPGLIQGSDKIFSGSVVENLLPQPGDNYSYTATETVTVTFDNLGTSPKGTIALASNYQCTNCRYGNNDGQVNCATQLNFTARKIDTQALTAYDSMSGQ